MAMLMASVGGAFAQRYSVSGRVVDSENIPIAYATVVILENEHQVAGATTDSEGGFVVAIAEGLVWNIPWTEESGGLQATGS